MAVKPKVLVTRRWPAAVEAQLSDRFDAVLNAGDVPLSSQELRAAIANYDAILPTVTDKISADELDVARPQARILANFGDRYGHIDVGSASEHGIVVTNTPDLVSECVADLAMTLLLTIARRTGEGERELRAGRWTGWRPTHLVGTKVSGKSLGIIGFGRSGQEMARRARHGFGMDIFVYDTSVVPAEILSACGATQVKEIDALLPLCDFVSLHCPEGAENRHLIDARRLNLMKPQAYLVNTSRGEVIDYNALADALWFGTIGGAALDVFEAEPIVNPKLLGCDNLVMLPHLGSATHEAREAMGLRVIDNLSDFFCGHAPRDRVN